MLKPVIVVIKLRKMILLNAEIDTNVKRGIIFSSTRSSLIKSR